MEETKIIKHYDKKYVKFGFEYIIKEPLSQTEKVLIDLSLDKIFNNLNSNTNIYDIVRYVRTVLKNYSETYLNLVFEKSSIRYIVTYKLKEITYYKSVTKDSIYTCTTEYEQKKGFKYNLEDPERLNLQERNYNLPAISKELETIRKLDNITAVELTEKDKILITLYRIFYKSNPDFTEEKDLIKIRNMCYLLWEYGINVRTRNNEPVNFTFINEIFSANLDYWLYQLKPIGINHNIELETLNLYNHQILKVTKISNEVRDLLRNNENIENYSQICNLVYIKKHMYKSSDLKQKLLYDSLLGNYTEEEIDQGIALIKKLD